MGQQQHIWTVPVSATYEGFLREIRRRLARRVASRSAGEDGEPVHREVSLTENNASLNDTYLQLVTRGMERANVHVTLHSSDSGRVERVSFRPPPVVALAPTTITASPPGRRPTSGAGGSRGGPSRDTGRRDRSIEQEGEVAGVASIRNRGRMFYGIRTTRHNTMCYGAYDNARDVCHGVETENTFASRLHYDQGMRDYRYLCVHAADPRASSRLNTYRRRFQNGASPDAPLADRLYREGALEGHRRHQTARQQR